MKTLSLQSETDVCFRTVALAEGPCERMRGLLGRKRLPVGHAMWFKPCASIHTFFMHFSIDLVFLSRELVVTDVRINVRPWRVVVGARGTYSVLEAQTGWLPPQCLAVGTRFSQASMSA